MNDKFDELAKGMAQSVTRRGALKRFGLGLAGIAVGLANKVQATKRFHCQCNKYQYGCPQDANLSYCISACTYQCQRRPGP